MTHTQKNMGRGRERMNADYLSKSALVRARPCPIKSSIYALMPYNCLVRSCLLNKEGERLQN